MEIIVPRCPIYGSEQIEEDEIDQTEDGAEVYCCKCLKCGHVWEEET